MATRLYVVFFFRSTRADNSVVNDGIWQKFELIQAFMHVLLPAKMKKIQSKMKVLEWPQHISHCKSMGIFDAQGQVTLQLVVGSGRNSNFVESLWLSSLPARLMKIRSKMKALEWPQDFPHYNPMGAICCYGNQSSDPI